MRESVAMEIGLRTPFAPVFRDLKQPELALRNHKDALEEQVRERTAELAATNKDLQCGRILRLVRAIVSETRQGDET